MGPQDISIPALIFTFLLLGIPLYIMFHFKLGLIRNALISVGRMAMQLFLMGIYLKYLLQWNISWLNALWVGVMVIVASFTVIRNAELNRRLFFWPVMGSLIFSVISILLYFNRVILGLENILDARYFIVIGGMFLGNSLRGNIIGVSSFFRDLQRNQERYLYRLAMGATVLEGVTPYVRNALTAALKPSLAAIATMGIVFLPGMMTGQILGGATPLTAIKYQIAIMVAIFVILSIAVTLTILLTLRVSFDEYGVMRTNLFRQKRVYKNKSRKFRVF
ncbi:MAG TPA: ABC transporter permease [bacterium]|nr:ABC transporter permease [bacterium]